MQIDAFLRMIEDLLEVERFSLVPETPLSSIDRWDSLAVVGFMAMVDESLDFIPSPEAIANAKAISDLLKICVDKLDG